MVEIRTDIVLSQDSVLSLRSILGDQETIRLIQAIKNQKWIIVKGTGTGKGSKVCDILREIQYPFLIDNTDVIELSLMTFDASDSGKCKWPEISPID